MELCWIFGGFVGAGELVLYGDFVVNFLYNFLMDFCDEM